MADAMVGTSSAGKGTEDASFWLSKAKALLAPVLYAAAIGDRTMLDVYAWIHEEDLGQPIGVLLDAAKQGDAAALLAAQVLVGIDKHDPRTRGGVFASAQPVLWAYGSPKTLEGSSQPNFDPASFVNSHDTVYITAPAGLQQLYAPLVVGLLQDIESATYERAKVKGGPHPPVLWALDEIANVAPFERLPGLVSEAGGQGLQVLACFQDLSQARARWGTAADGFLTLYTTKIVFGGIADTGTLESLSVLIGDWEKPRKTRQVGVTKTRSWDANPLSFSSRQDGTNETETFTTETTRIFTPGDIASRPRGQALVVTPEGWQTAMNATVTDSSAAALLCGAAQPGPPLTAPADGRRLVERPCADTQPSSRSPLRPARSRSGTG